MRVERFRLQHIKSFASSGWVRLGPITLLVGANNSGKSTLLRGLGLMQSQTPPLGPTFQDSESSRIRLEVELRDVSNHFWPSHKATLADEESELAVLQIDYEPEVYHSLLKLSSQELSVPLISDREPINYLYPYLSKRKVLNFNESVNLAATNSVTGDLSNLIAKIDRLTTSSHPDHALYDEMCRAVLGFEVTTFASQNGKQAGLQTGRNASITLDEMGEGVSSLLGLIVDLCVADGQLFLIEELENDVHPAALKSILDLIIRRSTVNQFIVSTHSNIVARHLGAEEGSVVQKVQMRLEKGLPTSTVIQIKNSPEDRIALLSELGYELQDFDLWEGWLLLEESSAERIIRDFLIPWFAPRLASIRTLAVGGVSKAEPTFADFDRLFRFTHLEKAYHKRAWIVLDGDEPGRAAITKMRGSYTGWPSEHFEYWTETAFEYYYPIRFKAQVTQAFSAGTRDDVRVAKRSLLLTVIEWMRLEEEQARQEFQQSAAEVITRLKAIEDSLWPRFAESDLS